MHQRERVVRNIKGEEKIVNFVFGSGVLTSNPPEIKEVKGYKLMSGFGFSIRFSNGKDKKPTYYALELWGNNAEHMARLGFENQLIEVCGRESVSKYKTTQGEDKEYKVLTVERFTCLQRKESPSTSENVSQEQTKEEVDENLNTEDRTYVIENHQDDVPF